MEKRRGWGVRRKEILALIPEIKAKIIKDKTKIGETLDLFGISKEEYQKYTTKEVRDEVRDCRFKVPVIETEASPIDLPNFTREPLRIKPIVEKEFNQQREFLTREEIKAQIIAVMSNMDHDLDKFVKDLEMRTTRLVDHGRINKDQANVLDYHLLHLYLDYQKI